MKGAFERTGEKCPACAFRVLRYRSGLVCESVACSWHARDPSLPPAEVLAPKSTRIPMTPRGDGPPLGALDILRRARGGNP